MDPTKCNLLTEDRIFDGTNRLLRLNSHFRNRFAKVPSYTFESSARVESDLIKDIEWTPLKYEELPQWLQWNEYLRQGYRPPLPSFFACFKSVFRIHTETVNIWSHLLACIVFATILIYNCMFSEHEFREKLALSPFVVGFVICFGLSTFYHTVCCHSERVSKAACTCDYLGIGTCLLGSLYSSMVYLWWCRWQWTVVYCLLYTVLFGIFVKVILTSQKFTQRDGKPARAAAGISIGCSSFIMLFHEMSNTGFWYMIEYYPMGRILIILITCVTAALLYSTRIPERFWPGKFDIWFHSHQIFHLLVATASFIAYHALLSVVRFRTTVTNHSGCDEKPVMSMAKFE